jgi:DNA-binding transcriptional MerR regulator
VSDGVHQDKGYLAMGELLDVLRPDFPDLTVSKIRFLEQQGLLTPERTPSGYRKFFPSHAARLRWILLQQEGTYLPLREIKSRLAAAESEGVFTADDLLSPAPSGHVAGVTSLIRDGVLRRRGSASAEPGSDDDETGDAQDATDNPANGALRGAPVAALGERRHPAGLARRAATAFASMTGPEGSEAHPSSRPSPSTIARVEAAAEHAYRGETDTPLVETPGGLHGDESGRRGNLRSVPAGAELGGAETGDATHNVLPLRTESVAASSPVSAASRMTFEELVVAAGMTADELRQIEQFGLVIGRPVAGVVYYDDDALHAALLAKSFQTFGVEPRHLRIFRTAVDREADFYAQVVSPLVYRREERSRQQALANLAELHQLGAKLREATLRQVLRTTFDLG